MSTTEECIICLEGNINYNKVVNIKKLNKQIFFTNCQCNYNIHTSCIINWLETKSVCPICHTNILIPYNDIPPILENPYIFAPPQIINSHRSNTMVSNTIHNTRLNTYLNTNFNSLENNIQHTHRRLRLQQRRQEREKCNRYMQYIFYFFLGIILIGVIFMS